MYDSPLRFDVAVKNAWNLQVVVFFLVRHTTLNTHTSKCTKM